MTMTTATKITAMTARQKVSHLNMLYTLICPFWWQIIASSICQINYQPKLDKEPEKNLNKNIIDNLQKSTLVIKYR